MIWLPVIAALAFGFFTFLERTALREKSVNYKHFIVVLFLVSVIVMIPFLFYLGGVSEGAYKTKNILILSSSILFGLLANIFAFYALKWEKLTHMEPIKLLEPLFVVVLAFAFFESERNIQLLIPALIAAVTLLATHVKKHHLSFNKYLLSGILGSLCYAIEIIIVKVILELYSPLSLNFIRNLSILVLAAIIFRPKNIRKEFGKKESLIAIVIGILWVVYRVISYYGYLQLGVIFTTLVLMIAPVVIYVLAYTFLKERIEWRNLIGTIIILACVVYATLV